MARPRRAEGPSVVAVVAAFSLLNAAPFGIKYILLFFGVVLAAVFWTWLWGIVGLLLATPLTVCLVVLGKYVPQLAFLDVLLGDEPVLSPPS